MTWFRVDDLLHDHPKVRKLAKDKLPALGLWVACGSWSGQSLSEGFVPSEIVRRFDRSERYAKRLVEVGLWLPEEVDGEAGYRFHQWLEHQPSKEEVLDKRAKRQEAGRRGGIASAAARRAKAEANGEANASASAAANAQAKTKQTGKQNSTPSRPVPSNLSSSHSFSPEGYVSEVLGLTPEDEETRKVIDLIKSECKPTRLGPYLRTLGDNGDLQQFLDRVREGAARSDAPPAAHPNAHEFVQTDALNPSCVTCGMLRPHAMHRRHLTVVGESA